MMSLRSVESRVREILTEYPDARDDDMQLYLLVCQGCISEIYGNVDLTFSDVMTNYRELGCPCYESVRRTRQKIQATTPSLRCSVAAHKRRKKARAEFKYYALDLDNPPTTKQPTLTNKKISA